MARGRTAAVIADRDADRPRSIRLVRVQVPLITRHVAAHGAEVVRDVVLVAWERADGVTGWGECPTLSDPGYVTETTEVAWRALVDDLAPAALGGRPAGTRAAPTRVIAAPAALADARLDAALRRSGTSLRSHIGGTRGALDRCEVLADLGASPEDLAGRARSAIGSGAEMVKVKIAPGHDLDVLGAVVDAVGADAVAADCNGSYARVSQLAAIDDLRLRYLEQPFAPDVPLEELAAMHRGLGTPVALDESLTGLRVVERVLAAGAADVLSVKPARLGGVEPAGRAVALAVDAGVDTFVGGMLELGIGRASAAAVATLAGCTLPTDLGPSSHYVLTDVCAPITTDAAGRLVPPDGPGNGRTPDPAAVARLTVDEVVLRE